ncbi:CHAT domain protein [Candidatus Magnetomorum sp. HK-1]|nr:CHAT domain protein [Candidatus Magnetomorum sp. HK-1]
MKHKLIIINVSVENEQIKINLNESGKIVIKNEFIPVDILQIEKQWYSIIQSVNSAAITKTGPCELDIIKDFGMTLGDKLLPIPIKKKLKTTQASYLHLVMDDKLINVPWELIFFNDQFLCQRFSMGRLITSQTQEASDNQRQLDSFKDMWIIVNPEGNLNGAEEEGRKLIDMNRNNSWLHTDLDSEATRVSPTIVTSRIRSYDMVHFAGHADFYKDHPKKSGWRLWGGCLSAQEISCMKEGPSMPSLIVSNACQSALTENWQTIKKQSSSFFSLANAFLISGVRHYVGSFWNIGDKNACEFSTVFYEELFKGKPVGEAVRLARQSLLENKDCANDLIWAAYILYGDPTTCYFPEHDFPKNKKIVPYGLLNFISHLSPGSIRGEIIEWIKNSKGRHPEKKPQSIVRWLSLIFILCMLVCFSVFALHKNYQVETYQLLSTRIQEKNKQYKDLVNNLSRSPNIFHTSSASNQTHDTWISRPVTMALLYDRVKNVFNENEDAYIVSTIERELIQFKRVILLERMKWELLVPIDRMIDPKAFEKFIQARFLIYLEIYRPKSLFFSNKAYCQLRMVDQASGKIEDIFWEPMTNVSEKTLHKSLSNQLILALNRLHPLRGKIIDILSNEAVVINIGEAEGVVIGYAFQVYNSDTIIVVKKLEKHQCIAHMDKLGTIPQKGVKVEWLELQ